MPSYAYALPCMSLTAAAINGSLAGTATRRAARPALGGRMRGADQERKVATASSRARPGIWCGRARYCATGGEGSTGVAMRELGTAGAAAWMIAPQIPSRSTQMAAGIQSGGGSSGASPKAYTPRS